MSYFECASYLLSVIEAYCASKARAVVAMLGEVDGLRLGKTRNAGHFSSRQPYLSYHADDESCIAHCGHIVVNTEGFFVRRLPTVVDRKRS
jgi:hypothetical protein